MVFEAWYLLHVMIVIVIYAMSYLGLRLSAIFLCLRSITGKETGQQEAELQRTLVKEQPPAENYKKSALTIEQSERILSRVQQVMKSEITLSGRQFNPPAIAQVAGELHALPS